MAVTKTTVATAMAAGHRKQSTIRDSGRNWGSGNGDGGRNSYRKAMMTAMITTPRPMPMMAH